MLEILQLRYRYSTHSTQNLQPQSPDPTAHSLAGLGAATTSTSQHEAEETASRDSSSDSDDGASPESRALHRHYGSLLKAMATADLVQFSGTLYAKCLINNSAMDKANLPNLTKDEKSYALLSAIMCGVEAKPKLFKRFIRVLKKEGSDIFDGIAGKLESALEQ